MTNEDRVELDVARLTPELRAQMAKLVLAGWKIRMIGWDKELAFTWIADTPDGPSFHMDNGGRLWIDLAALIICAWVYQHDSGRRGANSVLLP